MIRNVIFDMGGVLITIDHSEAVARFQEIGISEAPKLLDPYTQGGPFGLLEDGSIGVGDFIRRMSELAGREISYEECAYGWLGYAKDAPRRNFEMLGGLREKGLRLILLSNMNPFINAWLECEPAFMTRMARFHRRTQALPRLTFTDRKPLSSYFDACYRSFEIHMMKPDPNVFGLILDREGILPEETLLVDDGAANCASASELGLHTLQPENEKDWTEALRKIINDHTL